MSDGSQRLLTTWWMVLTTQFFSEQSDRESEWVNCWLTYIGIEVVWQSDRPMKTTDREWRKTPGGVRITDLYGRTITTKALKVYPPTPSLIFFVYSFPSSLSLFSFLLFTLHTSFPLPFLPGHTLLPLLLLGFSFFPSSFIQQPFTSINCTLTSTRTLYSHLPFSLGTYSPSSRSRLLQQATLLFLFLLDKSLSPSSPTTTHQTRGTLNSQRYSPFTPLSTITTTTSTTSLRSNHNDKQG